MHQLKAPLLMLDRGGCEVFGVADQKGLIDRPVSGVNDTFRIGFQGLNPLAQGDHGFHGRGLQGLFKQVDGACHGQRPPMASRSSQAPS